MNMVNILEALNPLEKILLYGVIILLVITLITISWITFALKKILGRSGDGALMAKAKYSITFMVMLIAAGLIIVFLKMGIENNIGSLNFMLFTALPYLALGIFLIGSIYRYRTRGFQVSSLSSQFLEGKKLFWGSQPFHWGILVLFFGHLIAFLFPRAIIAWNGQPIRLLILEGSAFAFGLLALLGLILFIRRRLTTQRVLMVTNKMDVLVYVVLLIQIISGLGVAFFVRWGSSWFASVLTPYLKSIFLFNPQIDAVSALPWLVQIHVVSAFFIVAIIPFTRFMHFLVVPIDYVWRSYQLVIWNWNRKGIRNSRDYFPGRKFENN